MAFDIFLPNALPQLASSATGKGSDLVHFSGRTIDLNGNSLTILNQTSSFIFKSNKLDVNAPVLNVTNGADAMLRLTASVGSTNQNFNAGIELNQHAGTEHHFIGIAGGDGIEPVGASAYAGINHGSLVIVETDSNDNGTQIGNGGKIGFYFRNGQLGIGQDYDWSTQIPRASIDCRGTDSVILPSGTTTQRAGVQVGSLRYNTTLQGFDFTDDSSGATTWNLKNNAGVLELDGVPVGGGGGGGDFFKEVLNPVSAISTTGLDGIGSASFLVKSAGGGTPDFTLQDTVGISRWFMNAGATFLTAQGTLELAPASGFNLNTGGAISIQGSSINFNTLVLTGLGDPVNPQDAVTKAYGDANYLGAGGLQPNTLNVVDDALINGTGITNATTTIWTVSNTGAGANGASLSLVSDGSPMILRNSLGVFSIENTNLNKNLEIFSSNGGFIDVKSTKIINGLDPTNPQDIATKAYVDSVGGGDFFKNVLNSVNGTLQTGMTSGATTTFYIKSTSGAGSAGIWFEAGSSGISAITTTQAGNLALTVSSGALVFQGLTHVDGNAKIYKNAGDPVDPQDLATKNYVDGIGAGTAQVETSDKTWVASDHGTITKSVNLVGCATTSTALKVRIDGRGELVNGNKYRVTGFCNWAIGDQQADIILNVEYNGVNYHIPDGVAVLNRTATLNSSEIFLTPSTTERFKVEIQRINNDRVDFTFLFAFLSSFKGDKATMDIDAVTFN